MQISREKIKIAMARKKMTVVKLSEVYGASRARITIILNSREVSPAVAGRLADALGVDVTEILED